MSTQRSSLQAHRRHDVFRLRPLSVSAPVGRAAFVALGDASLPGLTLRSNDVLCVSPELFDGGIQVLQPPSAGHPMLGHRRRGQLRSLPADLPCAEDFWAPVGSVRAVWRRELSASLPLDLSAASVQPEAGSPGERRALCVRVPHAAITLVRAERPELMGAPLQIAPQPGGTVLVFPDRGQAAAPVAQASPRQLRALADGLALSLGVGAEILAVSADEVVVGIQRSIDLPRASILARSLMRQLRLPIAVAVADRLPQALEAARTLGGDQLLYLLPEPTQAQTAAALAPRIPMGARPAARASAPPPASLASAPALRSRPRPQAPPAQGAVQLALFERAEAA
jgi:hypothetical protein